MESPAFVRAGGETASEQVLFLLAQPGSVADFSEHPSDFFFHLPNLLDASVRVEPEMALNDLSQGVALA